MKKISRILCVLLTAGLLLACGCKPEGAKKAEKAELDCVLPYIYNLPGSLTAEEYVRYLSELQCLLELEDGTRVRAADPAYELSYVQDGAKESVTMQPDDLLWSGRHYRLVLTYATPEGVVLPAVFSEKNVDVRGSQKYEKITLDSAKVKNGALVLELSFDWAFRALPVEIAEIVYDLPLAGVEAEDCVPGAKASISLWRGGVLVSVDVPAEVTDYSWSDGGQPVYVFDTQARRLFLTVKLTDPAFRFGTAGPEKTEIRFTARPAVGPDGEVSSLGEKATVIQMMGDVLVLSIDFPAE